MTLLVESLVILGCVYVLSVVVERYFVPALREIADRYEINRDIAGATLMAMGSSSPELAIALISLFIAGGGHGDIGSGTIVGSAVFNILVISGVSGLIQPIEIPRKIFSRDCVFYLLGVSMLLYVLADGTIHLTECLYLILAYVVYLGVLYGWNRYFDGRETGERHNGEIEGDNEFEDKFLFDLGSDVKVMIERLTGSPRESYWRAFFVSVAIIGIGSYVMVDSAVALAHETGLPEVLIGLTVMAVATSVPDLLSSISASRVNRGSMAISNAVGSNIFDILIGLGIPWSIAIGFKGETVSVAAGDLWSAGLVLMGTVGLLYLFLFTNRRLNRLESAAMIVGYVVFVGVSYYG